MSTRAEIQWAVYYFALAVFPCSAIVSLILNVRWLKTYFRSRSFPSTSGRLLKAEVEYNNSFWTAISPTGGGGYLPVVEFEYEVNGTHYESRQLTAVSDFNLKERAAAQAFVDQLRAEPALKVFYDPRAPSVAFLQHTSIWRLSLPASMALAFIGFSVGFWFHLHRP